MSFSLSLNKAIKKLKGDSDKIARGTLLSVGNRIIERSPVGNPSLWKSKPPKGYVGGSFRNGWQSSIGAPDHTRKVSPDASGQASIGSLNAAIGRLEMGQTFYMTNPLPYALRIEYGWSSQRPHGVVRRTILEFEGR